MAFFEPYHNQKIKVFLAYLARATVRTKRENELKQKIDTQLERLRAINVPETQQHLTALSGKLNTILDKENVLLHKQNRDLSFQNEVRTKIKELERKLNTYLKTREIRLERIKHLEEKIHNRVATDKEKAQALLAQLEALRAVYKQAKKETKNKKKLEKINEKIKELQREVKKRVK